MRATGTAIMSTRSEVVANLQNWSGTHRPILIGLSGRSRGPVVTRWSAPKGLRAPSMRSADGQMFGAEGWAWTPPSMPILARSAQASSKFASMHRQKPSRTAAQKRRRLLPTSRSRAGVAGWGAGQGDQVCGYQGGVIRAIPIARACFVGSGLRLAREAHRKHRTLARPARDRHVAAHQASELVAAKLKTAALLAVTLAWPRSCREPAR